MDTRPPLVVIAGPTASGKSALAVAVAERNDGVVVNADSAQVYRDLRVVTARPSPAEEARAPHRLFGHVDAADTGYSAARWAAEARIVVADTHAAGKLPILVGGTGLYLRTLIDGIAPVPAIDPTVRAAVRALPVAAAHALLVEADPEAAARLHANDTTRVHRALEVVRSTGRPLAHWQGARTGGIGDEVALHATILLPPRDWLDARIARRAGAIVRDGLAEVAALTARPDLPADAPVRRAIGVPEMTRLVRGEADDPATVAALDLATRRYAKRQFTWFRHQPPPDWAHWTAPIGDDAATAEAVAALGERLDCARPAA
ncbi:tRNA (adenosine(37)-N6)-dimethylallyltransferase MiaA [Sphingomonas sp.]|uniref:tRNA (adenosine(37)-N6)-dimethylallyltransferase MiaA n=1 Tax=Sphingomonas sp. TaxID=28214 RepID=UPI003B00D951